MMHRDEAIYARSDARGDVTLTAEEARQAAVALRAWPSAYVPMLSGDIDRVRESMRALAARLEAASTTPSP